MWKEVEYQYKGQTWVACAKVYEREGIFSISGTTISKMTFGRKITENTCDGWEYDRGWTNADDIPSKRAVLAAAKALGALS